MGTKGNDWSGKRATLPPLPPPQSRTLEFPLTHRLDRRIPLGFSQDPDDLFLAESTLLHRSAAPSIAAELSVCHVHFSGVRLLLHGPVAKDRLTAAISEKLRHDYGESQIIWERKGDQEGLRAGLCATEAEIIMLISGESAVRDFAVV